MFTLQHSAFESYCGALDGAGPKLKKLILDCAANDEDISLQDLTRLMERAYPEQI